MFLLPLFFVHDIFLASLQEGTTMSQKISVYSYRLYKFKSNLVICNRSEVYFAMWWFHVHPETWGNDPI